MCLGCVASASLAWPAIGERKECVWKRALKKDCIAGATERLHDRDRFFSFDGLRKSERRSEPTLP